MDSNQKSTKKVDTLDHLSVGKSCEILSISNQSGAVKRRLIDLGLTPGTKVTLIKIAPFGDPMEVALRGYEMSLRKADAAQITIRVLRDGEELKPRVPPRPNRSQLDKMRQAHAHKTGRTPQQIRYHCP